MLSKEEQKHYTQLPDNKIGEKWNNPEFRRSEIKALLKPLEEKLKQERDGEKRVSLLIEHAELLKELCRVNLEDNSCTEYVVKKCREILNTEGK